MRKTVPFFVLFLLLAICAFQPSLTVPLRAQGKKAPEAMSLKVGDEAPDFTLLAFDGKDLKKVSLQDFRGKKNVALAFYVFAFTGG